MEKFEINILGCGSATPTPRHNPSSQVINFRDNLFMIDCGEGTQRMMRKMKLRFSRLNHIFISHMHGDHCLGLLGLLSTLGLHERTGTVTVHLPAEGLDIMRRMADFFVRQPSFDLVFEPIEGDGGRIFASDSLTVDAFPLYHRVPCYGFLFRETAKMRHLRGDMVAFHGVPVSALHGIKCGADYVKPDGEVIVNEMLTRPADRSRSYAYCSDTQPDERVARAVAGVDLLYHEATYADDLSAQAHERGHSTAGEAGRIAAEAGARRLMIGHYSKRYTDSAVLAAEACCTFGGEVIAADEGLKIELK